MRYHQVEIDDEVFQFIKKHAEPLVDTFNSVLRRLLPLSGNNTEKKQTSDKEETGLPAIPQHIPQALRQVLEVVRLVRRGSYTRTEATQYVARQYRLCTQTVLDKYCRQLNLTAAQFDILLEEPDLGKLCEQLKTKFRNHTQAVDEVLGAVTKEYKQKEG